MAAGAGQSFTEAPYSAQAPVGAPEDPSKAERGITESEAEIEMVRKAAEVLGADHVARWMRSRIPSLGNQTPYTLIKTEQGRNQIERVLLKIEHGVY